MAHLFENLDTTPFKGALIFLDIDGTLVADNEDRPSEAVLEKIKELEKVATVWLCSNSLNHGRNETVRKLSKLPLVKGYRKPNKKILNQIPEDAKKLPYVVIGDKVLTDGLFAYRINAKFIKVKRKLGNDRAHIKLYNLADDLTYSILKLLNIFK